MTLITAYDRRTGATYHVTPAALDGPAGRHLTTDPPGSVTPPAPAAVEPPAPAADTTRPRRRRQAVDAPAIGETEDNDADAR